MILYSIILNIKISNPILSAPSKTKKFNPPCYNFQDSIIIENSYFKYYYHPLLT